MHVAAQRPPAALAASTHARHPGFTERPLHRCPSHLAAHAPSPQHKQRAHYVASASSEQAPTAADAAHTGGEERCEVTDYVMLARINPELPADEADAQLTEANGLIYAMPNIATGAVGRVTHWQPQSQALPEALAHQVPLHALHFRFSSRCAPSALPCAYA